MTNMTKVLVFGAFDVLHPGHGHMLGEARGLGDVLVVCLATDATIMRLKGHKPRAPYEERKHALELLGVDKVVPSDEMEGVYTVIRQEQPDVIAFGYDQHALYGDCVAWLARNGIAAHTVFLTPFEPATYKSSLLNPLL